LAHAAFDLRDRVPGPALTDSFVQAQGGSIRSFDAADTFLPQHVQLRLEPLFFGPECLLVRVPTGLHLAIG
jgi:hypothetical protein